MISNDYDAIIADQSLKTGVPFTWIKAVIGAESDFRANAYRAEPAINDASYGLMQLLERTARNLGFTGTIEDLYDPLINISLGTKLLAQLRASYGDSFERVYSAYNSGSPDKYQTSSTVAAHVQRAVSYLNLVEQTLTGAGEVAGSSPFPSTSDGGAVAVVDSQEVKQESSMGWKNILKLVGHAAAGGAVVAAVNTISTLPAQDNVWLMVIGSALTSVWSKYSPGIKK